MSSVDISESDYYGRDVSFVNLVFRTSRFLLRTTDAPVSRSVTAVCGYSLVRSQLYHRALVDPRGASSQPPARSCGSTAQASTASEEDIS